MPPIQCPQCQHYNVAAARFCDACGHALGTESRIMIVGIATFAMIVLLWTVPWLGMMIVIPLSYAVLIFRNWQWLKRPSNIAWLIWSVAFAVAVVLLIRQLAPPRP